MVSIVGASGGRPCPGERHSPLHARRANPMVGATRRVARYRAARRAAPTFRNDEVEAQSRSERDRWTFYETIKIVSVVSLLRDDITTQSLEGKGKMGVPGERKK